MTAGVWDERAEAYRASASHAGGADLDLLVEWCDPAPGRLALDVATGGGHVARRLREARCTVTTVDAAPGMAPDVVARAEELPFADASFDVVASRLAAHHFADPAAALAEMARVSRGLVVVHDTVFEEEGLEEAQLLRDPTHVRDYSEEEWRALFAGAGLAVERAERLRKEHSLADWLARTGCEGADAERVAALLAHRTSPDGIWWDTKLVLRGRKA